MRPRFDPSRLVAGLVVVVGALLFAREIGNDFLWGHDGGNGAPYWGAALTSVRFGTLLQAKGYFGLAPPSGADNYTHHPQLIHLHLVVARIVFGASEWAGRLVPYAYSVGLLVLLQRVGARLWRPAVGIVASLAYVLTPMHLVFASMIDHEQAGMFWTLAAAYAAVRVQQVGARRHVWATAIAGTAALQLAWASYFVLGVLTAIAAVGMLRSPAGVVRARARRVVVLLAVTIGANLGAFFLAVRITRGSMSDMASAYVHRASVAPDYAEVLFQRSVDLYGPVVLGLAAAGVARLLRRVVQRRTLPRDWIAPAFLLGQIGLSVVFRNAGRIHSYWTFYAGIATSLFAAEALVALAKALAQRWEKRSRVALALALLLVFQAKTALDRFDWGIATGHASYADPFDDQHEEIQVAKWLGRRYGRDATYQLREALAAREEFFFYLDAPRAPATPLLDPAKCPTRTCLVVTDVRREKDGAALATLSVMAQAHHATVFDGHIVAIDVTAPARKAEAFALVSGASTAIHRWFVSGRHAPSWWMPEADAVTVAAAALPEGRAISFEAESTKTGSPLSQPCPRGASVVGIETQLRDGHVVGIAASCVNDGEAQSTRILGARGSERAVATCEGRGVALGLAMPNAAALADARLLCGHAGDEIGTPAGYVLACPVNLTVGAVRARLDGDRVVGIGIGCGPL